MEWGILMIEIKDVTKKFGKKKVLNGVSFTAEKGKITCLIGINGVGKTTIMKAIMALTPIASGEILIDGKKFIKKAMKKSLLYQIRSRCCRKCKYGMHSSSWLIFTTAGIRHEPVNFFGFLSCRRQIEFLIYLKEIPQK